MSLTWLLMASAPDVIKFSIKTGTTTSTKKVILGNWTTPYDCIVDWGDGSTTNVTSNTQITHSYSASSTKYQIKITGKCGGFWNSSTRLSGYALVTSFDEVRSNSLKSLYYTFYNCTALATLPATINAPNLTNCQYAFYGCTANTSAYPKLWLTNPTASGANCFTKCFAQTMYKQYGTSCPRIGAYHAGTASQTYYQHYGNAGSCPNFTKNYTYGQTTWSNGCPARHGECRGNYIPGCDVYYSYGTSAYYSCGSSVGNAGTCGTACKVAYTLQSSQIAAVAAGWAAYA